MVQGTSSGAGKSLLATALCRHFARRGVRVAPFKAQNMSNNARVVGDGEIGTAQYLQALAAGVEPEVRMNPVLVKPEADTRSQVIVRGVADAELSRRPWLSGPSSLWPVAAESLRSLLDDYELVVLEGAGSPAEINLAGSDMTNLRSAELADAARADRRRHRPRRRLRSPLRHLGAARAGTAGADRRPSCSTSSAATRSCSPTGRSGCGS